MGVEAVSVRLRVLFSQIKLDQDDIEKYGTLSCFVLKNHKQYKYYGVRIDGKKLYLHRVIMNAPSHLVVDHINGDTTDNRKENLRLCTNIDNTKNLKKQSNGYTSKYKGVSYYNRDGTWEVNVASKYYGRYYTEKFAAQVYNEKASAIFGEFAKLNIIE